MVNDDDDDDGGDDADDDGDDDGGGVHHHRMIVMIRVHLVRKKGLEGVRFRMRASPHQIEIRVGMAYLEMMIE